MRIVMDILVVLVIVGVLGGIVHHHRKTTEAAGFPEATHQAVGRLQQEVNLHAALADNEGSGPNYPMTIDPTWFGDDLPRNLLVDDDRPWLEVASESEWPLTEPRIRATLERGTASFWYNPNLGVVRARVPAALPEAEALALYNLINETYLTALYE